MRTRYLSLVLCLAGCAEPLGRAAAPEAPPAAGSPSTAGTAFRLVEVRTFDLAGAAEPPKGTTPLEVLAPNPTDGEGNRLPNGTLSDPQEVSGLKIEAEKVSPAAFSSFTTWVKQHAVASPPGCEFARGYHVEGQRPAPAVLLACAPEKSPKIVDVWASATGEDMDGESTPGGFYIRVKLAAPWPAEKLAIMGQDVVGVEVAQEGNALERRIWIDGYWDREPVSPANVDDHKRLVEQVASALAGRAITAEEP